MKSKQDYLLDKKSGLIEIDPNLNVLENKNTKTLLTDENANGDYNLETMMMKIVIINIYYIFIIIITIK